MICYFDGSRGKRIVMQNAEKISITMTPDMLRVAAKASRRENMLPPARPCAMRCASGTGSVSRTRNDWTPFARVRRSLDDPRPDFSFEEVDSRLAKLHGDTVTAHGDAAT
jgi:antitoxin ParD1/3/4